jgi:hypothetical protein
MNYLELIVRRLGTSADHSERAIATVVAHGRDLFDALERSVFELGKAGWAVDDVKAFETDFRMEQAIGRERLKHIATRALDDGIDWFIEPVQSKHSKVAVGA